MGHNGNNGEIVFQTNGETLFSWAPKSLQMVTEAMESNLDSILKSRDITLLTKIYLCQSYGFSSSHVWMWELDHKESWALKKLMLLNCGVGEDSWTSLDYKEIKSFNLKGNQSWIFIGRTDAEAEALLNEKELGYLMRRTDSFEKTLMLGKIEGRRRRGWQRMR